MPWFVQKQGDEFCVVKGTKEAPEGKVACHPTEGEANAQLRALYVNYNKQQEARKKKEKQKKW